MLPAIYAVVLEEEQQKIAFYCNVLLVFLDFLVVSQNLK